MSRKPSKPAEDQEPSRAAARWYARHGSDAQLSPAAAHEWDEWIGRPDQTAEYEGLVQLVSEFRKGPAPPLRSDEAVRADHSERFGGDYFDHGPQEFTEARQTAGSTSVASTRGRTPYYWAAAAVLAVCVIGLPVFIGDRHIHVRVGAASDNYATVPGEHRQVRLEDGSEVTVGGDSAIRVQYTRQRRTIVLDRGEALFKVRRNPSRVFSVVAGPGRITALGTEFDVRLNSSGVVVAVAEGSVEVAPQKEGDEHFARQSGPLADHLRWIPLRLAQGQAMAYDRRGDASAPRLADTQSIAAWTRGSIQYEGRPLKEVIEDVQRYTPRHIDLDPAADNLQFTGIFKERDAAQWIALLPWIFPLEVASEPDRIRITLREPANAGD